MSSIGIGVGISGLASTCDWNTMGIYVRLHYVDRYIINLHTTCSYNTSSHEIRRLLQCCLALDKNDASSIFHRITLEARASRSVQENFVSETAVTVSVMPLSRNQSQGNCDVACRVHYVI